MKTKIEWKDGAVWRSVSVDVAVSRKGNWFFKHDGKVYVFKEKRQGEQVLVLENGKWVKAGRITRGDIFLGQGLSYGEFCLTPEGLRSGQEILRQFPEHKLVLRTQHGKKEIDQWLAEPDVSKIPDLDVAHLSRWPAVKKK